MRIRPFLSSAARRAVDWMESRGEVAYRDGFGRRLRAAVFLAVTNQPPFPLGKGGCWILARECI